jgi:sugar phosphate isomerase/epimerase
VSSWSVHRAIGVSWPNTPENDIAAMPEATWGPGTLSLMEVPAEFARLGIDRIEICSFHIPAHDQGFLGELRGALTEAGVTLQTLLIDNGDITDPVNRRRDIDWIGRWIDIAAARGSSPASRSRRRRRSTFPSPGLPNSAGAGRIRASAS